MLPASSTYKEGPPGRENGGATQYAQEDKVEGPPISLPEEDRAGGGSPWVGRTWMASCPGALRGGVAAKSPDHLPYMQMAGTSPLE